MNRSVDIALSRTVRAAVIRSGVQRVFVNRLKRAKDSVRTVVIVSPWITELDDASCPLSSLVELIRAKKILSYVFTRPPAKTRHLNAVELLKTCDTLELVYNENIHAKIYACVAPPPYGFALLGSANLTANSLSMYEVGLLISGVGPGSSIVTELANFGLNHLRTRPETKIIKTIRPRSLGHGA